jgi:hypothetical protein
MTTHHGAKLFGHKSHVSGKRKRHNKDALMAWAKKLEDKYVQREAPKTGRGEDAGGAR